MLVLKKNIMLKYFLITFAFLIGFFMIHSTSNPLSNSLVMWIFAIIICSMVKFDIFHPYVCFSLLFTLYSTAYAIIYGIGYPEQLGYTNQNILYSFIALFISIIVIGPNRIDIESKLKKRVSIDCDTLKFFLNLFSILSFLVTIILILRGYSGKTEMKQVGDFYYRIGVYFVRFCAMFTIIYTCYKLENCDKVDNYLPIALSVISLTLFSLITGERDAMLRVVVSLLLILFSYKKLKRKHLLFVIPAFALLMILSVAFKYFLARGEINFEFLHLRKFLYLFLSSDFADAGRNIQKLLLNPFTKGYAGYGLFFTELASPFVPSSVFFNPDHWFNYQVYKGDFHGHAFTLVGTGFIIDGLLGIIVTFLLVGLITRVLYRNSRKSLYSISAYIYMINSIVFSFRQSLSTIFSGFFRVVIVSFLICIFFTKRKEGKENEK